jgi:hypothetical protein
MRGGIGARWIDHAAGQRGGGDGEHKHEYEAFHDDVLLLAGAS